MCFTFPLRIGVQWRILPQALSLPKCGFSDPGYIIWACATLPIRWWKIHQELKAPFMILTVEVVSDTSHERDRQPNHECLAFVSNPFKCHWEAGGDCERANTYWLMTMDWEAGFRARAFLWVWRRFLKTYYTTQLIMKMPTQQLVSKLSLTPWHQTNTQEYEMISSAGWWKYATCSCFCFKIICWCMSCGRVGVCKKCEFNAYILKRLSWTIMLFHMTSCMFHVFPCHVRQDS